MKMEILELSVSLGNLIHKISKKIELSGGFPKKEIDTLVRLTNSYIRLTSLVQKKTSDPGHGDADYLDSLGEI